MQLLYSEFMALVRSGNVRSVRFEDSGTRLLFDLAPHSSEGPLGSTATPAAGGSGAAADARPSTAARVTMRGRGAMPRQFFTKRVPGERVSCSARIHH